MEATKVIGHFESLKKVRDGYWLNAWREVRRYVYPTYSDYKNEGGERGGDIFDTTAIEARKRLAAGMYNWMAPPDKRWFELQPAEESLLENEEVKDYFSEATKRITLAMANSNWATVLIQALNNLASGFDGVIYCEDGGDTQLNFKSFAIENICYSEDEKGRVNTVFREFNMSSSQLLEKFGEEALPEKIVAEANDPAKKESKHKVLHAVFPRSERNKESKLSKDMPFADCYILLDTKKIIHEGGFEELPYAVCRFEKSDSDSYGRGPGMDKLPDIKMLNRMRQAYILTGERVADPNWLIPDSSIIDGMTFNKDPGGICIYKPDINGAKPEPIMNGASLPQLAQDIANERESIKLGFFNDIFDPLGDLKSLTATEAEIRNDGKMIPFAPIAGNLHSELFRVIIHRVFSLLGRMGVFPPLPLPLVDSPEYKIEFVSKIALAIKKLESLGWLQTEASLANLIAVKPDIMDNFALDDITRDIAISNGANPKWIIPTKARDQIRTERAEQQAQMQQAEMLAQGAAVAPNLSKAPEPGSPLSMIMDGEGV